MVQILTPTPLAPITAPVFPTSNPALAEYRADQGLTLNQNQDTRAQAQEGRAAFDFAKREADDQADDRVGMETVAALAKDTAPPNQTVPAQSDTLSGQGGQSPNYDDGSDPDHGQTDLPLTPSPPPAPAAGGDQSVAAPIASAPSTGLGRISAAPIAPTSGPMGNSAPGGAPMTPAPMAPSPPTSPSSPLSSIVSAPKKSTLGDLDMSAARGYASAGRGRKALESARAGMSEKKTTEEQDYAHARDVLDAAEAGDLTKANLLIKQYGITDIDPQVLSSAPGIKLAKNVMYYAKEMHALHDTAWQKRFATAYAQSNDPAAALQAAGRPSLPPVVPKPNTYKSVITVGPDGKDHVTAFNTETGKANDTGQVASPRNKGAQRLTNEQINFDWMTKSVKDGGLGMDRGVAQTMITQVKENPGARKRSIMTTAQSLVNNGSASDLDTAIKQATKAYDTLDVGGGAAAPAAGGAPAAAPGKSGAPAAPSTPPPPVGPRRTIMEKTDGSGERIYHVEGDPPDVFYNEDDDTRYVEDQ